MNNNHPPGRRTRARTYCASTLEAQLVTVLYRWHATHPVRPTLAQIASWVSDCYGWLHDEPITARLMGRVLRDTLGIAIRRSSRGAIIPEFEEPKLIQFYRLYHYDPEVPPAKRDRYLQSLKWLM